MEELGFFETIKLIINNQPGLLAITIALLVAMSGRFGKNMAETIVGIILVFALGLQYLSATKENLYKLQTKYSIECINEKLEAIDKEKTLNIKKNKSYTILILNLLTRFDKSCLVELSLILILL